jgi:hypothetical protein
MPQWGGLDPTSAGARDPSVPMEWHGITAATGPAITGRVSLLQSQLHERPKFVWHVFLSELHGICGGGRSHYCVSPKPEE